MQILLARPVVFPTNLFQMSTAPYLFKVMKIILNIIFFKKFTLRPFLFDVSKNAQSSLKNTHIQILQVCIALHCILCVRQNKYDKHGYGNIHERVLRLTNTGIDYI